MYRICVYTRETYDRKNCLQMRISSYCNTSIDDGPYHYRAIDIHENVVRAG